MTTLSLATAIGALAALASTVSFVPQAWTVIRTRDVRAISPAMYALTVAAFALWLGYGALRGDWALIVPNALCLALAAFILAMTLLPRARRERVAAAIEAVADPAERPGSAFARFDREA
ncbi:MAG: SemiSWEET family sugar transporter [Novosphingobium sp.]